jgi:hypothetical protein
LQISSRKQWRSCTANSIPARGAACYRSCGGNAVDDLTCWFSAGLRPFIIGEVLIAE